jgi:hypothetical protein
LRRYCGRKGPMHVVAAEKDGLRDLYLTFKSNSKFIPAKFDCIVICGKKINANFLPNVITPKLNPKCCKVSFIPSSIFNDLIIISQQLVARSLNAKGLLGGITHIFLNFLGSPQW